ncbi:MAG: MBL fold metallo-hydrolase [Lachnospiraceae bacterium]|nr:MBL fold metallo-hydrolase [Lachnospiraceae bacterium]
MKIAEHIWLLEASRAAGKTPGFHCYLIEEEDGSLTMVDTSLPGRAEAILSEFREMGLEPANLKRILQTHTDMDHIGNAKALQEATGCTVYVSAAEKEYLTGERERLPMKQKMFEGFEAPETEIYPDRLGEYQIVSTPGHTAGHVCILYRACCFAGDCCSTESGEVTPPGEEFTEDMEMAVQSLHKIDRYSFGVWCPAHGLPKRHREP